MLKETLGKFYVKIRYLQFFVNIFANLTIFLLISLINEESANKKKLAKVKFNCHFNITKHLKIARRILENIKFKKRD